MTALLVPFCGVSRKIQASLSQQIHEECKVSHIDFPFLALGVDPSPCLFVCSSPIHSVVFFVAVKKCEIPWRNPLDESLTKNSIGFKKLISTGWPKRCITYKSLSFNSSIKSIKLFSQNNNPLACNI